MKLKGNKRMKKVTVRVKGSKGRKGYTAVRYKAKRPKKK